MAPGLVGQSELTLCFFICCRILGSTQHSLFCLRASLSENRCSPASEHGSLLPRPGGEGLFPPGTPSWAGLQREEGPSTAFSTPKPPSSILGLRFCIQSWPHGYLETGAEVMTVIQAKPGALPPTSCAIQGAGKRWFPHLRMGLQDPPSLLHGVAGGSERACG